MRSSKSLVFFLSRDKRKAACLRAADRLIDLFIERAGKGDLYQLRAAQVEAERDVAWAEKALGAEPTDFLWNNHQLKVARGKLVTATTRLRRVEKQREQHAYLKDAANRWVDSSAL